MPEGKTALYAHAHHIMGIIFLRHYEGNFFGLGLLGRQKTYFDNLLLV
jgi:hypothetical protein